MKIAFFSLNFAALALAAGCNDVRIIETYDEPSYYEGAFEFATQNGEIKTTVLGTPFGRNEEITPVTTGHMRGATLGRTVTFTPAGWTVDENVFRVVVLFNGKSPYSRSDLCRKGPELATEMSNGAPVRMEAAFCQGPHLLSFAEGTAANVKDLDDPRFRELVRGVALAMIPPNDTNKAGSGEATTPN